MDRDIAATVYPTSVASFPAVVATPTQFDDYCNVEVDVAPGQVLDIQFGGGSPQARVSQDDLCLMASQSARQAMGTLTSR
jgi:hypothetical protein